MRHPDETQRVIVATLAVGLMLGAIAWFVTASANSTWPWEARVFPAAGMFVIGALLLVWAWRRRVEAPHTPPGGGLPLVAPVDYQVVALRQVIAVISETTNGFGRAGLDDVLRNLSRTGTKSVYEPLMGATCREGLAWLAAHGELMDLGGGRWRIRNR